MPRRLLLLSFLLFSGTAAAQIDNAALIPKFRPDADVTLEGISPDWVKSLVIAELRLGTATPEGTFPAAGRVLDHYAQMGVNGLWINPVYERGSKLNGYGNFGPDTIEPLLTGAADTAGSFEVVRRFVDEAHHHNIRILFDIVAWGTTENSPLVTSHPEFYRHTDGGFWKIWNGYGFDWTNPAFRAFYQKAAVDFILKTGADGFRVDLAPDVSGYFFENIRSELLSKGRKIAIISEMPGERRNTFDCEQTGVTGWTEEPDYAHPENFAAQKKRFGKPFEYLLHHNLVDAIHSGEGIGKATLQQRGEGGRFRFYTFNLLCHDDSDPAARGNRITFAYATLFGPFIPMWWIGEEWNNPKVPLPDPSAGGVMYGNRIDWTAKDVPENAAFFEDLKHYLRIRRSYPEIFEHFAPSLRDANIVKIDSKLNGMPNPLQAYARTTAGSAVVIVPNPTAGTAKAIITLDPAFGPKSRVTDLLNDTAISLRDGTFSADLLSQHLGLYLIESTEKP